MARKIKNQGQSSSEEIESPLIRYRSVEILSEVAQLVTRFCNKEQLPYNHLVLMHISQYADWVPYQVLAEIASEALLDPDFRIRGEMCYALGRSGDLRFSDMLRRMQKDKIEWVRQEAIKGLKILETSSQPDQFSDNRGCMALHLSSLWTNCLEQEAVGFQKGKMLEQFAKELFAGIFRTVETNLRSDTEEIDLVLELSSRDVFWVPFGSLVFVECKNWSKRVGQKEITAFFGSSFLRGVKLAFFLAPNGFTKHGLKQMQNFRQGIQRVNLLIVPIEGKDIERMLQQKEGKNAFLKRMVRSALFGRR